ncbi:MAG: N-acetylmuramoyl-L-alanine amidase, partial [Sediminibacterium sp.]|nr:N-acetylmuramoyl-L-alanine amidase [Sediminibacterium sp.]
PYYSTNLYHNKTLDSLIGLFKQKINAKNIDSSIEINWVGTVNYGIRKPNFVIIHHTAQNTCEQTLKTFTNVKTLVSAHYVICKDGTIYNMLHDYLRAQHAGLSQWGQLTDINSASIGIELDNDGYTPFDTLQINSLIKLLRYLKKKYSIPTPNFIGHGDIAPSRKNDPNIFFPWKSLAKFGYGNWAEKNDSVEVESNFSVNNALRLIGYNTTDTLAAFLAFKRHFRQDTSRIQTLEDKQVLKQLINLK